MKIFSINGSALISGGSTNLIGYSFASSGYTSIVFRNGDDEGASGVLYVNLNDGESVRDDFINPIAFREGLFVDVDGAVEGSVWVQ